MSAAEPPPLTVERAGGIVHVRLDRPKRANALGADLIERLLTLLDDCARDQVRLLVISGNGADFCGGFDLGNLDDQSDGDVLWRIVRLETLLQHLFHAPFVTLGLAQGRAIGGGVDLLCCCTMRVATPDATFRMPGWRFGVALGTRRLVERVGSDAARSMLLGSRTFDATEAASSGLLQRVVTQLEWPAIIDETRVLAETLDVIAVRDLLAITTRDTRAEDMAALVATAGRPGLCQRIAAYREAERQRRQRS